MKNEEIKKIEEKLKKLELKKREIRLREWKIRNKIEKKNGKKLQEQTIEYADEGENKKCELPLEQYKTQ